jgi:TPR repeat protein
VDKNEVSFLTMETEKATLLISGRGVSPRTEARHDSQLAVDQGCDPAQSNYGLCPQNGDGILVDLERAAHYYQLAAD